MRTIRASGKRSRTRRSSAAWSWRASRQPGPRSWLPAPGPGPGPAGRDPAVRGGERPRSPPRRLAPDGARRHAPAHPRGRRRAAPGGVSPGGVPVRHRAALHPPRRGVGALPRRDDPDPRVGRSSMSALLALPRGLVRVLEALRAAGGRPYVVGGAVRDAILGLSPTNFDVEVYGLPAERVRDVLSAAGRVDAVGQSFTVYKLSGLDGIAEAVDVSLPRR